MSRWELRRGEALWELRTLEAQSVDAIITDPPYSSGGFTRGDRMAKPGKKYEQTGLKQPRAEFAGDNRDQRSTARERLEAAASHVSLHAHRAGQVSLLGES